MHTKYLVFTVMALCFTLSGPSAKDRPRLPRWAHFGCQTGNASPVPNEALKNNTYQNGQWLKKQHEYRLPIRVGAGAFTRRNTAVEVELDFNALEKQTGAEKIDKTSFAVVRVDTADGTFQADIPFQIDAAFEQPSRYILTFILTQNLPRHTFHHYHLYFSSNGVTSATVDSQVTVREVADHKGQYSYKISTPHAVYYYHKYGAGFAGLEDRDGNDWLSYNPGVGEKSGVGSGGMYRGTPNSGYPEGYCHPGKTVSDSRILSAGPVKATIYSQSNDKKMACLWDIFPTHARLTFLQMRTPYWFLYEGTPGGLLEEKSDYIVRPDGPNTIKTTAAEKWEGDIEAEGVAGEWIYFADGTTRHKIWFVHHHDDAETDSYWPMNGEMTVFGFGRLGLEKYMTRVPDRFTLGLCYQTGEKETIAEILAATQPPTVEFGVAEKKQP